MSWRDPLRIFIGYDRRESLAFRVCARSMRAHATRAMLIEGLDLARLRHSGLYHRGEYSDQHGQRRDALDGRPFSTDFSFSRFLVPALCQWRGLALFCDSDLLWREDVADLFSLPMHHADAAYAVWVVKHDHQPTEATKMRGQLQTRYPRKNWSSVMLWNCEHPANLVLTPQMVSSVPGSYLHRFEWLRDHEIGAIHRRWNYLVDSGIEKPTARVAGAHFTKGTPDMQGCDSVEFADEWREVASGLG